MPVSKKAEDRAARLVREGIDDALAEIRAYINRELAAGRTPDRRLINELLTGYDRLAEEYSIKLAAGEYGDLIAEAMQEGARSASLAAQEYGMATGTTLNVTREQVDAVVANAGWKVRGIVADGQRAVSEEILRVVVGGKSQREAAQAIADRLQVRDEAGDLGDIPAWRAELIARTELSSSYRSAQRAVADKAGFRHYQMVGPDDDVTNNDVCVQYLDQIHTVEEWDAIGEREDAPDIWTVGLHFN